MICYHHWSIVFFYKMLGIKVGGLTLFGNWGFTQALWKKTPSTYTFSQSFKVFKLSSRLKSSKTLKNDTCKKFSKLFLQVWAQLVMRLIGSSSTLAGTVEMQVGYNIPYAEFVQISPAYICKSCGYVLRDAMQTPCGHHYCEPCINRIFEHAP